MPAVQSNISQELRIMRRSLNVKELSGIIGLGKTFIYEQVKSGKIPCKRIGTAVRFDPAEIADWWDSR